MRPRDVCRTIAVILLRNLSFYALAALVNGAVPFLLLPILTHYLSPSDYGQIANFTVYVTLISPVIVLGMPALFSVEFHKIPKDIVARKAIVWLLLPICIGGVLTISCWCLRLNLAARLEVPIIWVPAIPLLALFGFIPQWTSVMLRLSNKPISFVIFETSQAIVQIGFTVMLVVFFQERWQGRIWSLLITGLIYTILGCWFLRPFISGSTPAFSDLTEAIRFGINLLPHSILSQLIRLSDRMFIAKYIGLDAVGEYSVGLQVASIMLVIIATFNQAWTPYLFKQLVGADDARKKEIVKISYLVAGVFFLLFLGVNLAAPKIFQLIISEKFRNGQRFVPFITGGYLALGVYILFTDYIFFLKKTYIFSIVTVTTVAINLGLNHFLVQHCGAEGVTYAFVISSCLMAIGAGFVAQKLYPMPWLFWVKRRKDNLSFD
jgi:O-antigen/teichoic acid export membrane protein